MERWSYQFGPFRFDPTARLLSRSSKTLPLTFKAADTLRVLVENRGQVVTKGKLLEEVWPGSFVEEGSVEQNISALRKALNGTGEVHRYIETLPKRGYRFTAPVRDSTEGSVARQKIIAILPFRVLGQKTRSSEVGLCAADATINKLAGVRGHAVLPMNTAANFLQATQEPASFGKQVGADLVLHGSVQFHKGQARTTVMLLNAASGGHLWAETFEQETFEQPMIDRFRFQDALAEELAGALTLLLSNLQPKLLNRQCTQSREAYQHYLKGRYHWAQRSAAGLKVAIACFRLALRRDPEYAPAYSGLANSYVFLPMLTARPMRKYMPKVRAAAISALEIDDTLVEARAALAFVKWHYEWDWAGAEREFRRILKFLPSDVLTRQWFALLLAEQGRSSEALEHMKRALASDPLDASLLANLASVLFLAGKHEETAEQAQYALVQDSGSHRAHMMLGLAREQQRRFDVAISELRKASRLSPGPSVSLGALGHALGCAGRAEEATHVRQILLKAAAQRGCWFALALAHLGLGECHKAVSCLERACEEREFYLVLLKMDPRFAALRGMESFAVILKKVGLSQR
jgi:DNA-binding winged helix-turn-helix (wHTH) protein/tetratricopeptide (TPR) repeat protein